MIDERASLSAVVALLLVSAWLGAAIVVAAVVAPSAFAVLPTRALAGALVGRVLPVLFWSGILTGIAASLLTWSIPGRVWRSAALLALVGACVAAQLGVAPRIARVRASAGGAIDLLAPDDPRRAAFGRLHLQSVAWMGLAAIAAAVVLLLLARSLIARPAGAAHLSLSSTSSHG